MKFGAAMLVVTFLAFSAFAGARVVVPQLPEAATPDAEVSTNIALNVDATRLQTLTFSVGFDACETNEVLARHSFYRRVSNCKFHAKFSGIV